MNYYAHISERKKKDIKPIKTKKMRYEKDKHCLKSTVLWISLLLFMNLLYWPMPSSSSSTTKASAIIIIMIVIGIEINYYSVYSAIYFGLSRSKL